MRRTGIVGRLQGLHGLRVSSPRNSGTDEGRNRPPLGGDGSDGSTGGRTGTGPNAGFAQQVGTSFDEPDADADGRPDEMPGEHRL